MIWLVGFSEPKIIRLQSNTTEPLFYNLVDLPEELTLNFKVGTTMSDIMMNVCISEDMYQAISE